MCLHVGQSQQSVGGFSELFGDWLGAKWWWQIVMLMYLPALCFEEAVPMSWLTGPQPELLCLTRSCWRGFAYSLDETSMKMSRRPSLILADIGNLESRAVHSFMGRWCTWSYNILDVLKVKLGIWDYSCNVWKEGVIKMVFRECESVHSSFYFFSDDLSPVCLVQI